MDFDHPPADPLAQFLLWFAEAEAQSGMLSFNAMTLATADDRGRPSARVILLKGIDEHGAVFYTNRLSRKGEELRVNPHAALVFYWDAMGRQVRIEGEVTEVSDEESDAYFASRPRESQIGAWASQQSMPVANRAALESAAEAIERRFEGRAVERPPHWGGYRVSLELIEFWRAHPFRLHDRIVYRREGGEWRVQRLHP